MSSGDALMTCAHLSCAMLILNDQLDYLDQTEDAKAIAVLGKKLKHINKLLDKAMGSISDFLEDDK